MIRKAAPGDIPAVAALYERIHDREEAGAGTTGWKRGVYPTEATAREALLAGELFVDEREGQIVAAARVDQAQVPEYALARWRYAATEDAVMVLHTLVVDPARAGQGVGTGATPASAAVAVCAWTPMRSTLPPAPSTRASATARPTSCPATSTAWGRSGWCAWKSVSTRRGERRHGGCKATRPRGLSWRGMKAHPSVPCAQYERFSSPGKHAPDASFPTKRSRGSRLCCETAIRRDMPSDRRRAGVASGEPPLP